MPAAAVAVAITAGAFATSGARAASAQTVEVTPAIGYRFGFPSYTFALGTVSDTDGAPSYGVAVDVKYATDRTIEGLFSRQAADVVIIDTAGVATRVRVTIDFWHGGATQEFGTGRVRPYLAGTLGITRYGEPGLSEVRFSLGAGGGVKLLATPHVGARLDGRVFATFVGGGSAIGICGPGICLLDLHVGVVWQADFSAGLLIAF